MKKKKKKNKQKLIYERNHLYAMLNKCESTEIRNKLLKRLINVKFKIEYYGKVQV